MTDTETFGFTFDGEAGDTFRRFVSEIKGWQVRVTTEDGTKFDALVDGVSIEGEWVNDVRFRRIENDQAVGDPFTVTVRNIHVY